MSNLQRHKDCTMRSEIGNCLAIGGFCTSVSKEICEGLQNAYTNGKHSVENSEDCISRATVLEIYSDLYWMDERLLNFKDELDKIYEKLRNAPSVIPKEKEVIYGNEHNCIMMLFGECSYSETGCGDCAVVEKVREALAKTQIETQNSNENSKEGAEDYERATEQMEHDILYEPTYNSEDGSM